MKKTYLLVLLVLGFHLSFAQPKTAERYFESGNEFLQQAKYNKAIGNYEKALALKPNFADAYSNMATAYYNIGENAKATRLMQKALQVSSNDSTGYNNSNYYYNPETIEETFAKLEDAIKINPRDLIAWYFLGLKYLKENNKKLGLEFIKKAAELGNLSAINYLKAGAQNVKK